MRKFLGLALVNAAIATNEPLCSSAVVDQAVADGFLEFVLLQCIGSGGKNKLGEDALGSSDCLTQFMITKQNDGALSDGIALTGACRESYQDLVVAIQSFASDVFLNCAYDSETVVISYACADAFLPALVGFADSNDLSIMGTGGMCPESLIRARTQLSDGDLMGLVVASALDWSPVSPVSPESLQSDSDGLCDICYNLFISDVSYGLKGEGVIFTGYPELLAECAADASSDLCMRSTTVENARAKFHTCAGRDIFFTGPLCTAEQVDSIQDLIPAPYYTLTYCAFDHGNAAFCATIPSYMAQIEAESNAQCLSCYTDYNTATIALANRESLVAVCVDVWSDDCMAEMSKALIDFAACTGFHLENVDTTTTSRAPTTTHTTTTTPETSTLAPTTTKGYSMQQTSLLVMACILIFTNA